MWREHVVVTNQTDKYMKKQEVVLLTTEESLWVTN